MATHVPLFCKDVKRTKAEVLERLSRESGGGYVRAEQARYEQMRKIIRKYE